MACWFLKLLILLANDWCRKI